MVLEFFLKEEGLKNQKIQKVVFPEKNADFFYICAFSCSTILGG